MALTIAQIVAASYNAVIAESRKPTNQWTESAFLRELERQNGVSRIPGGPQIEVPIDYRRNPGTAFLLTDLDPMAMGKTDVVNTAVYDIAQLSVPVVWSKADDAKNPEENQKVNFTGSLLTNANNSHDDIIEQQIFSTTTNGFLGLQTLVADNGQGTVGGINSAVDTFWRNIAGTFALAGTDILAKMTLVWNQASKGSGSTMSPSLIVSDAQTQATFEATQIPLQRYESSQDLATGFRTLAFKTGKYVFSQFGTARIYMLNPKTFKLIMYRGASRQKGDTQEIDNGNGYRFFIYTALQSLVTARSRCAVLLGV
jgi:hypothetical protein